MIDAAPTCPVHPQMAATTTCARCGRFVCTLDSRSVDAAQFCAECAGRPDVDWVEAYRQRLLGRRSLVEGSFAALALANVAIIGQIVWGFIARHESPSALALLWLAFCTASAIAAGSWFIRKTGARVAIIVLAFAWCALLLFGTRVTVITMVLPVVVIILAATYVAMVSAQSQLFFRLPVSRERLVKLYQTEEDNPIARHSALLGFVGLAVPMLGPAAILCACAGLRRVDPGARPPVGNRGQALLGLAFGAVGVVTSAGLVIWAYGVARSRGLL